jgi:hypothetical protein
MLDPNFNCLLLRESLLLFRVLLDHQSTCVVSTQTASSLRRKLVGELESTSTLDSLERNLEVGNRLGVGDRSVRKDESAQGNISTSTAILGKNHLIEVCGHSDGRRVSDHLILDIPLAIGLLLGQVKRACDDANGGVLDSQTTAEILKVRPVVTVKAITDLRAHVGKVKGIVHSLLGPFAVSSRNLMTTVKATAVVVLQTSAELLRDRFVFDKVAVLSVTLADSKRFTGDMLDDPVGVSQTAVVGGDKARAVGDIGDRAREAIFEETGGVDDSVDVDGKVGRRGRGGRAKDLGGRNGGRGGRSWKGGE